MIDEIIQIIGIGQCGTRIGTEFEKCNIDTAYINSDEVDVRGLIVSEKKMLLLETTGTGGSPSKGKAMIERNWERFTSFLHKNTDKSKMLLFIAGGGGGTGVGTLA